MGIEMPSTCSSTLAPILAESSYDPYEKESNELSDLSSSKSAGLSDFICQFSAVTNILKSKRHFSLPIAGHGKTCRRFFKSLSAGYLLVGLFLLLLTPI